MVQLLLLLLLPVAVYGYWKYFVGEPLAVRQQRSKYVASGLAVLAFLLLGVKTGSWAGAGITSLAMLLISWVPTLLRRPPANAAASEPLKPPSQMTAAEACEILGVPKDASRDVIMARYRKLIRVNHPDHGGSDYLAARIVAAKNTLTNR